MKLKFLKFVLPILLVLPSFVFAVWTYQRTPEGQKITSPITIYFKWEDWDSDICEGRSPCIPYGVYYRIGIYGITSQGEDMVFYGAIHDKTEKEITEIFDLPVGIQIHDIWIQVLGEDKQVVDNPKWLEECYPELGLDYCFEIILPSIGNTQNWLSQNEILGYIGKLAEDIPNYIALIMGLPIAFWFVEKIIAFVRGNFRSVEKIREE
jgi:hypothetical protein